jgi:glycosyltransferase involved in cell wall biosynthesis
VIPQKVSVIIPTMNEERSIGEVLDSIPKGFADVEVIVVDTNSKDRTVEIAKSKGAKVIGEPRRGYGRAYKTGFENARGEIIVTLDGDSTYPAEAIPDLVKTLIDEGLDFITCDRISKLKGETMNFQHRLGNLILTTATNILFGIKIKDSQSGMWVFRRTILKDLRLEADGMQFSEELKIRAFCSGIKVREIPIEYRHRIGDVKLNTWKDGTRNLAFVIICRLSLR